MKTLTCTLILAAAALTAVARQTLSLNRGWEFSRPTDSTVSLVTLPHDFQISQPWVEPDPDELPDLTNPVANIKSRLSARGFKEMGTGTYRRTFTVPPQWRGRRVLLDLEGIMLRGDVMLDSTHILAIDYGYLGGEADITHLLWPVGSTHTLTVTASTGTPENSRWYTGAGLYRDVNIILTDPTLYICRHGVHVTTPCISDSAATVAVEVDAAALADDRFTLEVDITDPRGHTAASVKTPLKASTRMRPRATYSADTITLPHPMLWSTDSPALYRATVRLRRTDGSVADSLTQRFGVRTVEYSPEYGMRLNGRKTLLKGIANHHTLGALGAAAHTDAIRLRLQMLKAFGFNHLRTSHNPYSTSLLNLCDSLGILVTDELYDKWLTQYAGGRRDWTGQWPADIDEFLRRDRNHPCVVMWSLGNELQTLPNIPYGDYGVTPYRMMLPLVRRLDPSRPVTVAMHPRGRHPDTDSLPAPLAMETDIAAYNYRYMYFAGDGRRYPHMMFYQSEANTSGIPANYFGMDLDRVIGLAYWGMIDYLGESQGWPAKGWADGVFDISLHPKPQAWLVRSYFMPQEPMVHIGIAESERSQQWNGITTGGTVLADHFNFNSGDSLTIYTFTNAPAVELLLNGRSLGLQTNDTTDIRRRNRPCWLKVPYRPGTLTAIARDSTGRPIARHTIHTASPARRLRITVADNGSSLLHLSVEAVDAKGRTDPRACHPVTLTATDGWEVIGACNGDITSCEPLTGPTRSLWHGRAQFILRKGPCPARIKASAQGLKADIVEIAK